MALETFPPNPYIPLWSERDDRIKETEKEDSPEARTYDLNE